MRILAITSNYPKDHDPSVGVPIFQELNELHRQGCRVTVFVLTPWCPWPLYFFAPWKKYRLSHKVVQTQEVKAYAIPYLRLPGLWFNRWAGLFGYWAMKRLATHLNNIEGFDILFGFFFFPDGDSALRLSRLLNVPVACIGRGTDVNYVAHANETLYRHFVHMGIAFDSMLASGESIASKIKTATNRTALVVFGLVDIQACRQKNSEEKRSLREKLQIPLNAFVTTFAGNLLIAKGVHELIASVPELVSRIPKFFLILCGDGPERKSIQQFINEKGLQRHVLLTGKISPELIYEYFGASDLFTLPSYSEGVPNAVMEAMACGLPVVTTNVGGIPSAMGTCEGVILIPPKDETALKETIFKLAQDQGLREKMARASRKKAEEQFDRIKTCTRILEYLNETVKKKSQIEQPREFQNRKSMGAG